MAFEFEDLLCIRPVAITFQFRARRQGPTLNAAMRFLDRLRRTKILGGRTKPFYGGLAGKQRFEILDHLGLVLFQGPYVITLRFDNLARQRSLRQERIARDDFAL